MLAGNGMDVHSAMIAVEEGGPLLSADDAGAQQDRGRLPGDFAHAVLSGPLGGGGYPKGRPKSFSRRSAGRRPCRAQPTPASTSGAGGRWWQGHALGVFGAPRQAQIRHPLFRAGAGKRRHWAAVWRPKISPISFRPTAEACWCRRISSTPAVWKRPPRACRATPAWASIIRHAQLGGVGFHREGQLSARAGRRTGAHAADVSEVEAARVHLVLAP